MIDPDEPKADPSKQSVLDVVPADAVAFMQVNVEEFFKSPSGMKLPELAGPAFAKFNKEISDELGVAATDVRRVVAVAKSAAANPQEMSQLSFFVFDVARPIDAEVIMKKSRGTKKEVDGRTILVPPEGPAGGRASQSGQHLCFSRRPGCMMRRRRSSSSQRRREHRSPAPCPHR